LTVPNCVATIAPVRCRFCEALPAEHFGRRCVRLTISWGVGVPGAGRGVRNHFHRFDDLVDMGCEEYGEAVSAMLDGEVSEPEMAVIGAHLTECTTCRITAARAAAVNRVVGVRLAEPVADDIDAVLAAWDRIAAARPRPQAAELEDPGHPSRMAEDHPDHPHPEADVGTAAGAGIRCLSRDTVLYQVGVAACGCPTNCACGCQQGRPCRCGSRVA